MTSQPRQPAGTTTGGRFDTAVKAEPLFTLEQRPVLLHPIGFNDEQTRCGECGREELRGTVILADEDGNEVKRVGTTCASRLLGVPVTRESARRRESVRRAYVLADLTAARDLTAKGRFADAAMHLRDARRTGLHRTNEVDLAAHLEQQIGEGLAARQERWAVVAIPGRAPAEVDTLAEAQAAAGLYARFGGYVARLAGDTWVPATVAA